MKIFIYCIALLLASLTQAAPFVPGDDNRILETLPTRSMPDAERQALRAAHAAWRAAPTNVGAVNALARLYIERTRETSDPRYLGYALALLAPWSNQANVPTSIRLLRAAILQRNHQFDPALAELDLLVYQDAAQPEAWLMRAAILLVRADYRGARASCAKLNDLNDLMLGLACTAQVDAATGRADEAYRRLDRLINLPQAGLTTDVAQWMRLSRVDIGVRLGREHEVEAQFRALLAANERSSEIKAAYSDWLLDKRRYADVIALTRDDGRDDALLLRRALAHAALSDTVVMKAWPARGPVTDGPAAADIALLRDRYQAARLRGDQMHLREEARFNLLLLQKPVAALALAQANWRVQKEAADAKILLAAAIAARRPEAAEPVQTWMRTSGFQDLTLRSLLTELGRMKRGAAS